MREIYGFLRLANPFGHPSQVRGTQVLVLQTCVDLRRLTSPFGQGFIPNRANGSRNSLRLQLERENIKEVRSVINVYPFYKNGLRCFIQKEAKRRGRVLTVYLAK